MIRQKIVESFYSLLFNDVWEIWFEQRRWLRMSPILWNKQANFIFVAEILNNYHVNLNKLFELKLPNTNIPTSLFWNEYNFESDLFLIGLSWSHRIRGKKTDSNRSALTGIIFTTVSSWQICVTCWGQFGLILHTCS